MRIIIWIFLAVFFVSNCIAADFHKDFRDAIKLFRNKDYEQGGDAFAALAKTAPTPESKATCLVYQSTCLINQKNYNDALEVARSIEIKPIAINTEMEVLLKQKKYQELIDKYASENIDAWPEDYIPKGYANRGFAYMLLRNYKSAISDYEKAVDNACDLMELVLAMNSLAGCYGNVSNEEKALETYLRAIEVSQFPGHHTFYRSVLSAVGILTRQGKTDEALQQMKKLNLDNLKSGNWLVQGLEAYGDIYVKQGEKEKTLAKYKEAIEVKDANKAYVERIEKKIEILTAAGTQQNK